MQAQAVGTTVRITNVFTDSGELLDPDVVTLTLKAPGADAVIYTYGTDIEVIKDGTGEYRFEYVPAIPGTFVYVWSGVGTLDATTPGFFEVLPGAITALRTPKYMTSADLDARIGATKVDELFCDDGSGVRDSVIVNTFLVEAEDFAATRMIRSWAPDQVAQMATYDETFKGQVAWVACELASERRHEFLDNEGKGRYWAQYMRAREHFDLLSKSRISSAAEATIGANKQSGGRLSPTITPPASRFLFAPDKNNPTGHGGF
jgi:hypothetical protein